MGDNLRRYQTIRAAIKELYPGEPRGNQARHLNTLAALISGIVGSKSTQLPAIAHKVPDGAKRDSRTKRFARWVQNERIDATVYFLPYVEALLTSLGPTLLLAMDGSAVGRNCVTLVVSVVYHKRALPLAWIVVTGSKGHFAAEAHVQLLEQVQALIPAGARVILLGDGEFDGITFQATVADYGWAYVCRTAQNIRLTAEGEQFTFPELGVTPGRCIGLFGVAFTAQQYGPILAIAWWRQDCKEPIYLVTNMDLVAEACYWYAKRFRIETFFSDQKSRGFHLHQSHLSDPARLARLMIAACLAYIWIIHLGVIAKQDGWVQIIHRADRCDLSLFHLGLDLLEHFLNEDHAIPVQFQMPRGTKSVR
ncbi:MAG: IS4 family transposase [Chloroflexi bacterium]|nr:IS4 family transposase [Chloroflexota bacterium]